MFREARPDRPRRKTANLASAPPWAVANTLFKWRFWFRSSFGGSLGWFKKRLFHRYQKQPGRPCNSLKILSDPKSEVTYGSSGTFFFFVEDAQVKKTRCRMLSSHEKTSLIVTSSYVHVLSKRCGLARSMQTATSSNYADFSCGRTPRPFQLQLKGDGQDLSGLNPTENPNVSHNERGIQSISWTPIHYLHAQGTAENCCVRNCGAAS